MPMDRRRMLATASLSVAAAGVLPQGAGAGIPARIAPTRSLRSSHVGVAAVQSVPSPDVRQNLGMMVRDIERLATQTSGLSLIAFSATALQGARPANLDAARAMSIALDGPEIIALSQAARRFAVHVAFGALTTDTDWPGHVIPRNILIAADGRLVAAAWQAGHDHSAPYLTHIEGVFDRFTALYGNDAALPVVSTDIGNIALASDIAAPEIYRTLALKGADIIVRLSPHLNPTWDVQAVAAYNQRFVIAPMAAAELHASANDVDTQLSGGGSLIVGPRGEVLAQAGSRWSQTLTVSLALAHARESRDVLNTHAALVMPAYANQA